jgi:ribonuclease PH
VAVVKLMKAFMRSWSVEQSAVVCFSAGKSKGVAVVEFMDAEGARRCKAELTG